MHYGHALKFGTFIPPLSTASEQVVARALRSEALGYDLVTFQDHPYQPAFLDTWTLLSWVAGQAERIHLAANVLNLPLRAPAVLARSAASLDLPDTAFPTPGVGCLPQSTPSQGRAGGAGEMWGHARLGLDRCGRLVQPHGRQLHPSSSFLLLSAL